MTDIQELLPCPFHETPFGSYENYVEVVPLWGGKNICVDACMVPELKLLWREGIRTIECCCGHGKRLGYVAVDDASHEKMFELGYAPHPNGPHCFGAKTHTEIM